MSHNTKVAIRCRPPSTKEINNNEGKIVEMQEAFAGNDGAPRNESRSCSLTP